MNPLRQFLDTLGKHMQNIDKHNTEIWSKITGLLHSKVNEDTFNRWFARLTLVEDNGTHLVIAADDEICLAWVETNYAHLIQESALIILEGSRTLTFKLLEEEGQSAQQGDSEHALFPGWGAKVAEHAQNQCKTTTIEALKPKTTRKASTGSNLNPNFNFSNFVVGPNNQFAHAAGVALTSSDLSPFNPLFLHGGSGLGKTHLMQAIGNEIARERGSSAVIYLTCEQFTNEFIEAIGTNSLAKFRRKYRKADVLLLDDVQFFGGKDRTQDEFFHTFNTLFNGHKHIVLSSDCPASEISKLEPRLASRFECGLTVEILPPSMETRLAILQQKRKQWGVTVGDSILQFLAERIRKNVRRMEGALMRVATYASLSGGTPDIAKVEVLLRDILREENSKQVTIDVIQRRVSEHFEMRLADMSSRRRPVSIAFPRQIAMYLSRKLTSSSLQDIGEAFGGRDHGTVIHAHKTIAAKIEADLSLRDLVERLSAELV